MTLGSVGSVSTTDGMDSGLKIFQDVISSAFETMFGNIEASLGIHPSAYSNS
jgi:hypothetical protein